MTNIQKSKLQNLNNIQEKAQFIIMEEDEKLINDELKFEKDKRPFNLNNKINPLY